jgi:hypothetical protein
MQNTSALVDLNFFGVIRLSGVKSSSSSKSTSCSLPESGRGESDESSAGRGMAETLAEGGGVEGTTKGVKKKVLLCIMLSG